MDVLGRVELDNRRDQRRDGATIASTHGAAWPTLDDLARQQYQDFHGPNALLWVSILTGEGRRGDGTKRGREKDWATRVDIWQMQSNADDERSTMRIRKAKDREVQREDRYKGTRINMQLVCAMRNSPFSSSP